MKNPRILSTLPVLLGISLLQGCLLNPAEEAVVAKPAPAKTVVAKPVVAPKAADKPVVQKAAVKSIKTTSKPGEKLTPEEVEDMIRKLSVCRPH